MALTEAQKKILDEVNAQQQAESQYADVAGNPWFRTALQGASAGWSDEIEAAVRSVLPESVGGGDYTKIRDELRAKLAAYKQANPKTAITTEIVGALVPSLLTLGMAAPASAAGVARTAPSLWNVAKAGMGLGAVQGLGTSEANTVGGQMVDTAAGAALGGVLSPSVTVATKPVVSAAKGFVNYVREKMGDKASTAVQAELGRLQELTGKSVDEIIADINNGRLMSDNKTLFAALKDYVVKGGESGRAVLEKAKGRAQETKAQAMSGLQEQLAPNMESNVVRGFRQSQDELQAAESAAYKKIFAETPDVAVNEAMAADILHAAQTVPGAVKDVNAAYSMRKLVPLFKTADNGAVELVRQPTLQDAEMIRRALKSKTDELYRAGSGDLAGTVKELESSLRSKIDDVSGALKSTRQQWADIKGGAEAFDYGRKALTSNVDELEILVSKLKADPKKFAAFKAGVMDSVRNKVRRSGTTLANLADADKQFGAAIRTVLDGNDVSKLMQQLDVAGATQEIASKLPITAGSITAPLLQASKQAGSRLNASEVSSALHGSPTAMFGILAKMVSKTTPQLTDAERMQIVQTLYSRDPELVQRALTDNTGMAKLADAVGQFALASGRGIRKGLQYEAVNTSTGLLDKLKGK